MSKMSGVRWIGLVWAGFIILSALALWVMYPSYQVQHHRKEALRLLKEGQTEQAILQLEEHARLQPTSEKWLVKLGRAYLDSEPMQPQKALEQFQAALALKDTLDLALELGICWSEVGETQKAEAIFAENFLPGAPNSTATEPAVNYYLGRKTFEQGHYRKAAHYFQAASADPRWDARAEPYRQKIAEIILKSKYPENHLPGG